MADPATQYTKDIPRDQTPVRSEEIRNNFAALAATFFTQDTNEPASPEKGWFRLIDEVNNPAFAGNVRLQWYDSATWRTIAQNLQGGIAAPAKLISDFTTPTTTWVVDHNLGSKPLALVFDSSLQQLQPVQAYEREVKLMGRVDLSALVPGLSIPFPVRSEGRILETYAQAPSGIPGTPAAVLDWAIDATPSGGAATPVTGGSITIPAGPHAQGIVFPGATVTAANTYSQQLAAGPGVEDIIAMSVAGGVVAGAGFVDIFMVVERSLQPGQYRLTHINDNRFNVEHPADTAGSVIIVG